MITRDLYVIEGGLENREQTPTTAQSFQRSFMSPQKKYYIPFQDGDPVFAISEVIPFFKDKDKGTVAGLVFYEITPHTWSLVYCHTDKLKAYEILDHGNGYTSDYCDFYERPMSALGQNFEYYLQTIFDHCHSVLLAIDLEKDREKIIELSDTMQHMRECTMKDFTLDIYVPPRTSSLTGERYIRPGQEYGQLFKNPFFDVDLEPSQGFLGYLSDVIKNELPEHGFRLSCNIDQTRRLRKKQQMLIGR